MEKVTISRVYISDKNKDGDEYKTKAGKKFWKVGIQTNEYGEEWFSALAWEADAKVMQLQEGDTPTVVIEENNGFKNFKLPTKLDLLESRVEALERAIKGGKAPKVKDEVPYPTEEINAEDIPF